MTNQKREKARVHDSATIAAQITNQTDKDKGGIGLTAKVITLLLAISLLPITVYFYISSAHSEKRIVEESDRFGVMVSELLVSEVDEWIDKNIRVLRTISRMPEMTGMDPLVQETLLKTLQKEYPWMYLAFTTDNMGMNIARSDGKALKDYSNRRYVDDIVIGSELAWQNLIGKTSKKPALVLAVPIKKNKETIGVLAAAMTRDALSNFVTIYKQGHTGSSFLVDQTGKTVAHKNNAYVSTQKDMSKHPLVTAAHDGQTQRVEFIDANGQETLGFSRKTKLGWVLGIQQEKKESMQPLKDAQRFAYILLTITSILILCVAFFASRAIVFPVKKLTDAANRISFGDLEVEIDTTSKDELGDLAKAVMRLQDSIKLSITRLKRLRD